MTHQNATGAPQPVVSVAPLTLAAPSRGSDLQIRVSMPASGNDLPVIIFSHGYAQSHDSYGPLVNYWAAHGFVVIQPTHLDSRMLGLLPDDARTPRIWQYRESDLLLVLDRLGEIEDLVSALKGRLDRDRIAVAGHSWGATTASTLLGVTHPDPDDGSIVTIADARIKAGVLLCVAGTGGDNLNAIGSQYFAFMHPDFSAMRTPALIIAGDKDQSQLSRRGPEWWRQAFDFSPGPKMLFTAFGGEHSLGGISDTEAKVTTDENPERVAAIQQLSTAYLRNALYPDHAESSLALNSVAAAVASQGSVEAK